jgi:hypothetical protein
MPTRRGSEKTNVATRQPTLAQAVARADPDPPAASPYAPFADLQRQGAIASAAETLEAIKATQTRTHDARGRIRHAKFKAAVLALRYEGFTPKDTAEILGVGIQRVTTALTDLRADAKIEDQIARIDDLVVPLAVDNVARGVMDGDKDYTLRVMDGRGLFRTHKSLDVQSRKQVLILKIETTMPDHLAGAPDRPLPRAGSIVGAPKLPGSAPEPVTDTKILRQLGQAGGQPVRTVETFET